MRRWLACAVLGLGCGADSGPRGAAGGGGSIMGEGPCNARAMAVAVEGANHVAVGTEVAYGSNPPSSGNHYPYWGRWGAHDPALERSYWVHNLEHGGVVVLYRCDCGSCPDVAALQAFLDARPQDPSCTPPVRARLVLTADPKIPTPIAAAAWGQIYLADCVDVSTLGAFVDAAYGKGPEALCNEGQVP